MTSDLLLLASGMWPSFDFEVMGFLDSPVSGLPVPRLPAVSSKAGCRYYNYCPTDDMIADVVTKPLTGAKFI